MATIALNVATRPSVGGAKKISRILNGTQPCATADPDAFYPADEQGEREAKLLCMGCPLRVQQLCLQSALDEGFNNQWGVWAGYTAAERRELIAAHARTGGDFS